MTRDQIEKVMMEELGSNEARAQWQASLDEMTGEERDAIVDMFGHLESTDELRKELKEIYEFLEPFFIINEILGIETTNGLVNEFLGFLNLGANDVE